MPLEKNNSDCFQYFMLPSVGTIDYVQVQFSEAYSLRQYNLAPDTYRPQPYYGCVDQKDVEKADQLHTNITEYLRWSYRDRRIYQLLTQLEQEITIETLVKVKKNAFVAVRDQRKNKNAHGSGISKFFEPLPASYQIPGLEALKKHARHQEHERKQL